MSDTPETQEAAEPEVETTGPWDGTPPSDAPVEDSDPVESAPAEEAPAEYGEGETQS